MKSSRLAAASLLLVSVTPGDSIRAGQAPGTGNNLILDASYATGTEVPWTAHGFSPRGGTVGFSLNGVLPPGSQLLVVKNTSADFIEGTFDNLAHGQVVTLSFGGKFYPYLANYFGGTGNDLVLLPAATRAFAWGENSGTLGDGTNTNRANPAPVLDSGALAGGTVVALAAGTSHSLALRSDGKLADWGDDSITGDNKPAEVAVEMTHLEGRKVVAVAAGSKRSLALCSDGTLAEWGAASISKSLTPAAVTTAGTALEGKKVVNIAAGKNHVLAICSDGSLVSWGANFSGALGDGTTTDRLAPVAVKTAGTPLAGKTVVAIAAGQEHSLALCSDGTLASWGDNSSGSLGDGTTADRSEPGQVTTAGTPLAGRTVVSIAAGLDHNLVLCSDGTLAAWGGGGFGALGNGTVVSSPLPVAVTTAGTALADKTVVEIAAGLGHSLARCSDGTLAAWGRNVSGELGDTTTVNRPLPVKVDTSLTPGFRFTRVFASSCADHTLTTGITPVAQGTVLTVVNTNDSGPGSLRQAIVDANLLPDANLVNFAITPEDGTVKSIRLLTELPAITAQVMIDGYTQSGASPNTNPLFGGFNSVLRVEIDGAAAGTDANGLELAKGADACVVRGLVINRFNGGFDSAILSKGSAIAVESNFNVIEGNFLGTDPSGKIGLGNKFACAQVHEGSYNTIRGNLMSASELLLNMQYSRGNAVEANLMGTDVSGTKAIPNGPLGGARLSSAVGNSLISNVISSSEGRGLGLANRSSDNHVVGNRIGTTADGSSALGNKTDGFELNNDSNDNRIIANIISGNGEFGIRMRARATRNVVQGNHIGTDASGLLTRDAASRSFGNGLDGIFLDGDDPASGIRIGGVNAGEGNMIANNGGVGVRIVDQIIGSPVLGNSIFGNAGLGIDLAGIDGKGANQAGITANDSTDADTGANNLQNHPILASAAVSNDSIVIQGALASLPNASYRLEYFTNTEANAGAGGQGRTFLGASDVMTNSDGTASFSVALPWSAGAVVTATATDIVRLDTSEFSSPVTVTFPEIAVFDGTGNGILAGGPPSGQDGIFISDIPDQVVTAGFATASLPFTVGPATASLSVTGSSSNQTLVPDSAIFLAGSGPDRTVMVRSTANERGTAIITLTVSDGKRTATDTFLLTVNPGNPQDFAVRFSPKSRPLTDGKARREFGSARINKRGGVVRKLTITNTGTKPLTGLAITKDGNAAADFFVKALPRKPLAPRRSITIDLVFRPKAAGPREAFLHIVSKGARENPFDLALSGRGMRGDNKRQ